MNLNTLFKANLMLMGLIIVVAVMYTLNNKGLPDGMKAALSIDGQAAGKLSWCETRVASLIRPDGYQISQEEDRWMVTKEAKAELGFIQVEKWFGEFCKVDVTPVAIEAATGAQFTPSLFVKFIKGGVQVLGRSAEGVYQWKGEFFRSQELDKALAELDELSKAR